MERNLPGFEVDSNDVFGLDNLRFQLPDLVQDGGYCLCGGQTVPGW